MPLSAPNWKIGLGLALLSDLVWGVQPLAMGVLSHLLSPTALVLCKVSSGAAVIGTILGAKRQLPNFRRHGNTIGAWLLAAAIFLSASFLLYTMEFKFLSPVDTQLYLQLSRVGLAFIGIFIFKESFSKIQWLGLAGLTLGFGVFYHDQSGRGSINPYQWGVLLAFGSALTWALFAGIQKFLLSYFSSLQILFFTYIVASVLMTAANGADLSVVRTFGGMEWTALTVVCLSNLIAYASFSEALRHWEATRVSAVSCLTPFITILFMLAATSLFPAVIRPEALGWSAIAGAALVVAGAILVSLTGRRQ